MAKVIVVVSDGFETIEALTQVDFFRRAKLDTYLVSADDKDYINSDQDVLVKADLKLLDVIDDKDIELIFIPGGRPNAESLRDNKSVTDLVSRLYNDGKLVASICAGPMVLEKAGILEGKKATIYPGMEDHISSANPSERIVVRDGNLITGQGPAISPIIAYECIEYLKGPDVRKQIEEDTLFNKLPLN
ncbi:MAG: DJ-1/PfpI family protein [Tissierellia bacterium]|nr:DJ-1/PfpI family protein [Tissierellia bacterium]